MGWEVVTDKMGGALGDVMVVAGPMRLTSSAERRLSAAQPSGKSLMYSAFANSCPLQTDTFLFPLIHSHNVPLSSNSF